MKKNMGSIDRRMRAILAIAFVALYFTGIIQGTLAILLISLSFIFFITSFIGFCPLYWPFKFSTKKKRAGI